MNSVHEPGPNGDSETIPSRKTRSKTKLGARAPKLAQLGTQAHTGARMPGRVVGATAVSWPSCPVVSRTAWPYRSAHARVRRVLRPSAVSQLPSGSVAAPQRQCRRPCSEPLAVSWAWQCIVSRHNALPCLLSFNWLQSRYNLLYLDTAHQAFLQYNPLYCNTNYFLTILFG